MSCYESEKGGWTFPSKGWAQVRQKFIDEKHKMDLKRFEVKLKFYELSKAASGSYKEQKEGLLKKALESVFGRVWNRWNREYESDVPEWADSYSLHIKYGANGRPLKPLQPKKLKKEASMSFSADEGHISLNFKARHIEWNVHENNRSVDRAWNHPMGEALSSLLSSTDFTGTNGGYTIYRSEYQESYEPQYNHVKGKKYRRQCYGRA